MSVNTWILVKWCQMHINLQIFASCWIFRAYTKLFHWQHVRCSVFPIPCFWGNAINSITSTPKKHKKQLSMTASVFCWRNSAKVRYAEWSRWWRYNYPRVDIKKAAVSWRKRKHPQVFLKRSEPQTCFLLVGGFNPFEKYSSNWIIFPR